MHGINAEANSTTSNHQRGSEEQKKNLGNYNNKNKKPNDVDAYNEMTTTNMHQQQRRQRR